MQHFNSVFLGKCDIICWFSNLSKGQSVKILVEFHWPTIIEDLPVSQESCGNKTLLVLAFQPPWKQVSTSVDGVISILSDIWKGEQKIFLDNFTLSQMLQEHFNRLRLHKRSLSCSSAQGILLINWKESLFENSVSMSYGQRILWTAVEKFCNLLTLLNLYFYITLGTLFI